MGSHWDCKEHKEMVLLDNQSIGVRACSVMSNSLWPRGLDPVDCSLSGFCVHGTLQARILDWVAVTSSAGSFWPMSPATPHCRQIIYHWVTGQAHGTKNRQLAKSTGNNWMCDWHLSILCSTMPAVRGVCHKGPGPQGVFVLSAFLLN